MERIKQAVERARRERSAAGTSPNSTLRLRRALAEDVPDSLDQIAYTKTRTVDVPRAILRKQHIVSGFDPCGFTESFKMLSTRVSRILHGQGWNTVAVTSAAEGEGKTLVALNLAISLAKDFERTALLVEADLRKPSVHEHFGLEPGLGLSDYLNLDIPLEQLLVNPGIPRFVFLPGGTPQLHSSEMLGWDKTGKLVEELKERYPSRIVVFDLPPLLAAADVLAFAPHVQCALLVVEEGKTHEEEIQRAAELLASTPLIGTVLNMSHEPVVSVYGYS